MAVLSLSQRVRISKPSWQLEEISRSKGGKATLKLAVDVSTAQRRNLCVVGARDQEI